MEAIDMISTFRTLARGAALGFVIAAAASAATPAQAWTFSTGSGFWNQDNPDRLPELAICQTDYQVRRAMAEAGYENIYLGGRMSPKRVQVKASLGNRTYLLNYNRCTRQVLDIQQVRGR
jgi:hypothetical protein